MAWPWGKDKPKQLKQLKPLSKNIPSLPKMPELPELPGMPEMPKQLKLPIKAAAPVKHGFFQPSKPQFIPKPMPKPFFANKPIPVFHAAPKPAEIKYDNHLPIIEKSIEDIKELSKKHKDLSASQEVHLKKLVSLETEFDEHRNEMMDELKAINKNLGPLYDKDVKLEKDICDLTTAGKQLVSEIEKLTKKIKDMKDIVTGVETAYSPENIKKIVEQINMVNEAIRVIQSKDETAVNILQHIDRKIGVVERHSQVIDAERAEMKASADALVQHAADLRETVGGYSNQLIELSSKSSANIAKTADIDGEVRNMHSRMQTIEGQVVAAERLSELMQEHSRILSELVKRLDYLEKSTIRTVVLE